MLRNTILLFSFIVCSLALYGQTTLLTEDFEAISPPWFASGSISPNYWIIKDCAGNGPSLPGSTSLYITKGGAVPGCGATGDIQYAYDNSAGGIEEAVHYTSIDATCASNLQVTFDYQIDGIALQDFCELVYSTDGGTTWIPVGGELPISGVWTTTTIGMPGAVDGIVFDLGFRFTYDNATVNGNPPAIDNLVITGTDVVDPVMTCPTSINLPVDGTCTAICDDYTKSMLTLSDNCTDSIDIVVTQDIPEFTVFGSGPGGTESITLTATDEAGNTTQCTFTLNVIDNILPVITCPADTNVYVNNVCDGTLEDYTGDVIISDNCSAVGNMTVTQSPPSGTIISGVIIDTPVTMTVTDESGNSANCVFTARTLDTMVATITCPIDTTVFADASCQGLLLDYTGDAVVYDNCVPAGSLSVTQSPPAGTMIAADQVITLTVSGGVPNIDQSCTFNGILVDTISPTITCPVATDLYVDNSCQVSLLDYTGSAVIGENCTGPSTVSQSPIAGTIVGVVDNNMTVTLTVVDDSGNSSQCQFTQPIFDTISPAVTCPADQNETADVNCQSSLGDYTGITGISDNCSAILNLTQSPASGTTITGTTAITMTLTDEYSNTSTCVFNVDLVDVTAPTVTCPGSTTVSTDTGCDHTLGDYTGSASGADNCTPAISLTYSQNPAPGTLLGVGIHTITITAMDLDGNTGSCTFDVTVEDQIAPVVSTCPSNQTVYADVNCESTIGDYTGLVSANTTDNCSTLGNITFTQSPASGTLISSTTPITITVEDENMNTTSCLFNVILTDTISPAVICPSDQNINIDASCQYIMPDLTGSVGGTDNCSALGNMTISQNPAAGTTQGGITAVLITLADEQGNNATCITNMIPNDTSAPTITCPSPAPVDLGVNCDYTLPNYGTTALVLDNCSGYSITQTPAPGTIVNPGMTTIDLVVTDVGGNTDQCSFVIDVTESQTPTITCPGDVSTCDPVVTYTDPVFGDNCFAYLTQTDATGLSSGMTFPVGITTLEYTVSDSSGNTQTCTFDVEILDYPGIANIVDDTIQLCDQNSTILSADPVSTGQPVWSLESGQGTFNNQFAATTGVNNLGYGANVFIWTVNTSFCGFTADTVIVINSQQDLQASTQDTIYSCTDATVSLQSNTPLYGIGTWTTDGAGVIDDANSSNTFSTLSNGWQDFVWTITSGGCPPTSDTLHVFAMTQPSIDQNDTLVCLEDDLITLSTSVTPNDQSVLWSVLSGSATIDSPSNVITDIHDFGLGTNLITVSFNNEVCPSTYDTIVISGNLCEGFDPVIPTVITPGNLDGKNDVFVIDFLNTVYPDCKVTIFNRWGSVVFESVGYPDPWNGTYKGELLPMGTYFYHIDLNDGSGEVLKGDISIIH